MKLKFLQCLKSKLSDAMGSVRFFVLLTLIFCISIAIIMFPKLLKNTGHSIPSEGRINIGILNRTQAAFYLEHKYFATSIVQMKAELRSLAKTHEYEVMGIPEENPIIAYNLATPLVDDEKAYLGSVSIAIINSNITISRVVCSSKKPTGKNPSWEGIFTQKDNKNCNDIIVGNTRLITLAKYP